MIKVFRHFSVLYRIPAICALAAALAACATSGIMQGRLSGQPVQLHYHHSFWDQNGTIMGVLPDGEHFKGKFVVGTNSTTGIGIGAKSGDVGVFSGSGNTSQAAAVLNGDRGDSMYCRFTLSSPTDGLEGGGVGHCKLSTGQSINVTF